MDSAAETNLPLMLAIGTAGMLLMAVAIILFVIFYQKRILQEQLKRQKLESQYQRQLLEASIESQEAERKRIASDLHDEVGAMLSAVKLNIGLIVSDFKNNKEGTEVLSDAKGMIDEAITSVRRISKDLLPATLEQFGLSEALRELCSKINTHSPIEVTFVGDNTEKRLDAHIELSIYRIGQEFLNNALKHAQPKQININLAQNNEQLTLVVEDDGIGFDYKALKAKAPIERGVGIFNLESRASLVKGTLDFEKGMHGRGTKALLTVNLAAAVKA